MVNIAEQLDVQLSGFARYWHTLENNHPLLTMIANTAMLFVVFVGLDAIVIGQLTEIPESGYDQNFLIVALLETVLTTPFLIALLVATCVFIYLRWSSVSAAWVDQDLPNSIRIFIVFVAAIMSWVCASYDYNLFLDRYYHLDRLLLLLVIPCIYWRPAFLIPYLCLLSVYVAQYNLGLGGFSWAEFSMLMRMLLLALAVLTLRACLKRNWSVEFLLLAVCLIASHYWIPGLGKYDLSWHWYDEPYRLLPNTYANGWLAWLDAEQLSTVTRWVSTVNAPLRIGTLILEWGVLLVLWRKKTLQVFLICWVGFHLSIFLVSGIFFWKWILLETAFLLTLQFLPEALLRGLFTGRRFAISVVIIASSGFWSQATRLSWLDMPLTYTYRFTAVTENNQKFLLPPAFFAPYDYQFTLGKFAFLSERPTLPVVWGATADLELLKLANQAKSPQDVLYLELNQGRAFYNLDKVLAFDRFMINFVEAYNRRGGKPGFYSPVKAPRQLWTFPSNTKIPDNSLIQAIHVEQVLSFFDGQRYIEIDNRQIHAVNINDMSS